MAPEDERPDFKMNILHRMGYDQKLTSLTICKGKEQKGVVTKTSEPCVVDVGLCEFPALLHCSLLAISIRGQLYATNLRVLHLMTLEPFSGMVLDKCVNLEELTMSMTSTEIDFMGCHPHSALISLNIQARTFRENGFLASLPSLTSFKLQLGQLAGSTFDLDHERLSNMQTAICKAGDQMTISLTWSLAGH